MESKGKRSINSRDLATEPIIVKEKDGDLEEATVDRVKRMREEFSEQPTIKLFKNTEGYDQMITQVNIPFSARCEHHKVAIPGQAHIAYIPDEWLTGLSKLARVVEYYLNPTVDTIQERATHQIINHLGKALNPKGIMLVIEAQHNCVSYRGVKKPSQTITSAVSGVFRRPTEKGLNPREEFLALLNICRKQ